MGEEGQLDLLDVVLRHRAEPELTLSLTVTDVSAVLYYPDRTPEEYSQEMGHWPSDLLTDIGQQLRQS